MGNMRLVYTSLFNKTDLSKEGILYYFKKIDYS